MKIVKLPWLCHEEQKKKFEIYSLSVNADGSRLASGGLDGHVRIWDISTIQEFNADLKEEELPDKSLCQPSFSMARHTGAVTTVKFSPNGRFLASGSDDRVVLIWEKDEETNPRPAAFGEDFGELEHWTVRKRLVAHENDVQDIAWAPDSSILVTVGLDRSIIVWNGTTFEKIKRFDLHNSHVKGVVFDPANKFFATASDDRSVIIFRYHKSSASNDMTISVETSVSKPFEASPLTSYFRRLSWSPDGQHIAVPNATNGPVTSVAIINRGDWNSDVSLIGHTAPCEVVSFSPRLFELPNNINESVTTKKNKKKLCSIVATAGQDRVLALWKTSFMRPCLVANEITLKTISDLAWTPNGRILFVCSLDGTITTLFFQENELGIEVPLEENDQYLHRYGADRESLVFPESVSQLKLEDQAKLNKPMESRLESLMAKKIDKVTKPKKIETKVTTLIPQKQQKLKQVVKYTKEGKKRIAPMLMTSSKPINKNLFTPAPVVNKQMQEVRKSLLSTSSNSLPRTGLKTLVAGLKERKKVEEENEESLPLNNKAEKVTEKPQKQFNVKKAKSFDYPSYLVDLVKNSPQEIAYTNYNNYIHRNKSTLVIFCENSQNYFEAKVSLHVQNNYEYEYEDETDFPKLPTRIISTNNKAKKLFEVFLPHSIINGIGMPQLGIWVLVSDEGSVFFVSFNGKQKFPRIDLNENICSLKSYKSWLLILTNRGLLYFYNLQTFKALCKGISLSPIINNLEVNGVKSDNNEIFNCDISNQGMPIVILKNGESYGWSLDLWCWMMIE